jgi:hypothetical protein
MPDEAEDEGWSGVSEAMARQILLQAETYLQAQLQLAISADSRATSMASLYVTLTLAVLGGGLGYWHETGAWSPLLAGLVSGGFLTGAAVFAAWAARPVDFYLPGNVPDGWMECRKNELAPMLGYEAENYGTHIDTNNRILGANQDAIRRAYKLAIAAPIAGAIAWLVTFICLS